MSRTLQTNRSAVLRFLGADDSGNIQLDDAQREDKVDHRSDSSSDVVGADQISTSGNIVVNGEAAGGKEG